MLFLDDFLEMLEELPAELKERGEEIRRLDGDVEMRLKRNREAINDFFERTGVSMSDEQRTERFNVLKDEYSKIRKMSEKKIEIATKMQDLLTKYQNHLEKEKTNFQCEMEADNSGVTETIEKRYTEYVESLLAARKERKRRHRGGTSSRDGAATASGALTKESSEKINRILQEGSRLGMDVSDDSASQSPASSAVPSPAPRGRPPKNGSNLMFSSALLPNDDYSAPSPTIRRKSTANGARGGSSIGNGLNNLNSSSSRVSPNVSEKSWSNHGADESVTPQTTSFTVTTPQTQVHPGAFVGSESRHGRPRKLTSRVQEMFKETLQRQRNHGNSMMSLQDRMQSMQAPPPTLPPLPPPPPNQPPPIEHEDGSSDDDEDGEDSRRWCFCNEKSYGEMVACDNKGCPYMWFHYPCVGVMAPPKGKWYCPHCTGTNLVGSNPTEDGLFIPSTSSALPDDL